VTMGMPMPVVVPVMVVPVMVVGIRHGPLGAVWRLAAPDYPA